MAGPLNHVVIAMPRNGTSSFTVDPATASGGTVVGGATFAPTSGRMLVCGAYGAITLGGTSGVNATPPSGWTKPGGNSSEAVNNGGLYVWYRTASATTADRITAVANGSNYPAIFEFWEFEAGTTWSGQAFAISVASGGAGPSVTGLTGTNWTCGLFGTVVSATAGTGSVTWAAGVEQVESLALKSGTDGYLYSSTAIEDDAATSRSIAATFTAPSGAAAERIVFAVKVAAASGPPTATPAFTGSGTLSVGRFVSLVRAAALSGSGALTAAAVATVATPTPLSGSGALTVAVAPAVARAVGFTGSGTLSAGSGAVFGAPVSLSGSGALTAAASAQFARNAALSGDGSLTVVAVAALASAVALSGSGQLAAASAPIFARPAALSGSGQLTASTGSSGSSIPAFSGSGALSVGSAVATAVLAAFSGSGQLAAAGSAGGTSTAALSGDGMLTAGAVTAIVQAVQLAGEGALTVGVWPSAGVATGMTGAGQLSVVAVVNPGEGAGANPTIMVNGIETDTTWSIILSGVESPVVVSIMVNGVETPVQ